jgi:hypothetical protein
MSALGEPVGKKISRRSIFCASIPLKLSIFIIRASLTKLEDVLAYGHRYYSSLNKKHIEELLRSKAILSFLDYAVTVTIHTAKTQYRKFETKIPRKRVLRS